MRLVQVIMPERGLYLIPGTTWSLSIRSNPKPQQIGTFQTPSFLLDMIKDKNEETGAR